jgi:hypothetical protein
VEVVQIESLQVTAHVQENVSVIGSKRLDLAAVSKMIVDPVNFARPRVAGIKEDQPLKALGPRGMEFAQRFGQGAFADAGGPAQDDQTAVQFVDQRPSLPELDFRLPGRIAEMESFLPAAARGAA